MYLCLVSDGPSLLQSWCPVNNSTWHFYFKECFCNIFKNVCTIFFRQTWAHFACTSRQLAALSACLWMWSHSPCFSARFISSVTVIPAKPTCCYSVQSRAKESWFVQCIYRGSMEAGNRNWLLFWWQFHNLSSPVLNQVSARPVQLSGVSTLLFFVPGSVTQDWLL